VSENAIGEGATYAWTGSFGPIRLKCTERVVEWKPGERVAYEGELGGMRFRSSMEVAPAGSGSELRVDIGFEPKYVAVDPVIESVVRHDIRRSLASVRKRFQSLGDPEQVVDLYRRRAGSYDWATQLYRLVGFPLERFRDRAVDALCLRPGDTVVEIGCGTGANFSRIVDRIGPSGRLIGVDLTDAMLERARARVKRAGWSNVELVQSDAGDVELPEGVDGILSTLALTLVPRYEDVIARGARAVAPGGRWVIADLKEPEGVPPWLLQVGLRLAKPYGVTLELGQRHPWETLRRELPDTRVEELFFGVAYVATGRRAAARA
jgi:demethylmenaquinone methyltransferase/2-methoxy-6-polyprenyl-1,4-benzoquinol methylase